MNQDSKDNSFKIRFLKRNIDDRITGIEGIPSEQSAVDSPIKMAVGFRNPAMRIAQMGPEMDTSQINRLNTDKILEAVTGTPDFLPAWFLQEGTRLARSICKIETCGTNYAGAYGHWSGTGFLVSENILLTNNHVLNSIETAKNGVCKFDYEVEITGQLKPVREFRIDPERLFFTSPAQGGLDFTFVWVNGQPGKEFGFVQIDRNFFKILPKDCANIIQHPNGRPKSIVLRNNLVLSQNELVVHYLSDTEPGSSGSCVFNNLWRATALHHAADHASPAEAEQEKNFTVPFVNEGIKFSAIATYLENIIQTSANLAPTARELIKLFDGTDSAMGFFGSLGRVSPGVEASLETLVQSYHGELKDIDVGFWNVEWFNRNPEKAKDVAEVVADMNLDIWAFEEASPSATDRLINILASNYGLDFSWAASEPHAPDSCQTTTVIWNKKTVTGKRDEWPSAFDSWFAIDSRNFNKIEPELEAVDGKVFSRYPGLFYFESKAVDNVNSSLNFYLVPLHLKAMKDGSLRRAMAARILAAAIKKMIDDFGKDTDWIVGGDYNAELATSDFQALLKNMVPLSAEDESHGVFTYLKTPNSLIDHIFISSNMAKTYGAKDYFVMAAEKTIPDYLTRLSDHRPVFTRLSLKPTCWTTKSVGAESLPEDLTKILLNMPSLPQVMQR